MDTEGGDKTVSAMIAVVDKCLNSRRDYESSTCFPANDTSTSTDRDSSNSGGEYSKGDYTESSIESNLDNIDQASLSSQNLCASESSSKTTSTTKKDESVHVRHDNPARNGNKGSDMY